MNQRKMVVLLLLVSVLACAKTPPNLTPEATVAFKGTQAVKALDLLRDTAISAHAQTPPLLAEDTTRRVVLYHQSTVKIIQASPSGWVPVAQTGLDELVNNLSPPQKDLLGPYLALLKTVLNEVTR